MDYLLKANATIILFYLCYKLFLQKETFFESNRYFLLAGIATASTIPFIVIPIYIEKNLNTNFNIESIQTTTQANNIEALNFTNIITWIYLIGISIFTIKFLIELISLLNIIINNKRQKQGDFTFIETNKEHSPFSFFKFIVYNPTHFTVNELEHIILHEKIHARQYHSIDILIIKASTILFWFNPFIWLYNKSLKQNLEFIADEKTQNKVEDSKTYQTLLLKTIVPKDQLVLVNNFYNSLIKKRIIMLHKSKSNKLNTWKYSLILPFLALFLMSFNTKEVIIPIENEITFKNQVSDIEVAIISKDASDAELENIKKQFKKQGFSLEFKGLKRNKNNEITKIKISAKSKNSKAKYEANSDEPIASISIKFDSKDDSIAIGSHSKSENEFHFSTKHGKSYTIHEEHEEHEEHEIKESKSNVFVFSNDDDNEEEIEVIIENGKHKIKTSKNDGNVYILKENNKRNGNHTEDITIVSGKDGNTITKEVIINGDSGSKTIIEDDHVISINSKGDKGNIMFTSDTNKNPLIIYNGKQISKNKLNSVNSKKIKSVNVLKGESATNLYGDKGKDGVIIISSKE